MSAILALERLSMMLEKMATPMKTKGMLRRTTNAGMKLGIFALSGPAEAVVVSEVAAEMDDDGAVWVSARSCTWF